MNSNLDFPFSVNGNRDTYFVVHTDESLMINDPRGTTIFMVNRHVIPERTISLLLAKAITVSYLAGVKVVKDETVQAVQPSLRDVTQRQYFVIKLSAWDQLVKQAYSKFNYELLEDQEEGANRSCLKVDNVKSETRLSRWDALDLEKWLAGTSDRSPGHVALLQDLVSKGILAEGNYLIEISY